MVLAGGNAVDAAVAIAAAVGVVEPFESNLLGGSSCILFWKEREKRLYAVEASGCAPERASTEAYRALGGIPLYGPASVVVPGSFDGWCLLLAEHGTARLADVLTPAMELAEHGFPVSPRLNQLMVQFKKELLRWPSSARVFLKEGEPHRVGELLAQKDLGRTLKTLISLDRKAKDHPAGIAAARDWVYGGGLADQWSAFIGSGGGFLNTSDLARYRARYVSPLRCRYRDLDVYTVPPPSQGVALLEMLNVLSGYDLQRLGHANPETLHVMVEALKLGFEDRELYVADPDFVSVPTETLLSRSHAEAQRRRIRRDQALVWPFPDRPVVPLETTTLVTADQEGNLLVATTSIGRLGLVAGETGVALNNRMRFFHDEPDHPNHIAPRKRSRVTLNPIMAFQGERPMVALASPATDAQSQAQLQALLAIVDFGLDAQSAAETPRWESTAFPDTSSPHRVGGTLILEPTFPDDVGRALRAKGHQVQVGRARGMITVIQASPDGGWIAGADPRAETYALGW